MQKYKMLKDLPWMKKGLIFWLENGYIKYKKGKTTTWCSCMCYHATVDYFFDDEFNFFGDNEYIEKV